jgi:hypothetical protein
MRTDVNLSNSRELQGIRPTQSCRTRRSTSRYAVLWRFYATARLRAVLREFGGDAMSAPNQPAAGWTDEQTKTAYTNSKYLVLGTAA